MVNTLIDTERVPSSYKTYQKKKPISFPKRLHSGLEVYVVHVCLTNVMLGHICYAWSVVSHSLMIS